ncbi:MAG: VIT1/CCC1 transporter family protein [Candidatus Magasanikbacteria bacterium]|nr:VIT1/CCC1 transporter family protein [Candidatus Magasanikbacteria bacterium]
MPSKSARASYIRSFVFGVEDSLSSTVGLLSGLAIAGVARDTIFITGVILILVEAVSMSIGDFLSEHASEEYLHHKEMSSRRSFFDAVIMLFSYAVAGLVPLAPYLLFPAESALAFSISFSLGALFLLGITSAHFSRLPLLKNGFRTFLIGGVAIAIGVLVGTAVKL